LAKQDKPRIEVDEVDPNVLWEIQPDGSRRQFRPGKIRKSSYRGFENWLNTKTGETYWGLWPPPWIKDGDKRRRRGPRAIARGFLERIF
jgi:hypothetical protein